MGVLSVHVGEGNASPRADVAAVRLRLSLADRVWAVVRWAFTLTGAVVVLWFGAAFLTAAPAVAVPRTGRAPT